MEQRQDGRGKSEKEKESVHSKFLYGLKSLPLGSFPAPPLGSRLRHFTLEPLCKDLPRKVLQRNRRRRALPAVRELFQAFIPPEQFSNETGEPLCKDLPRKSLQ
jgi:hypothetical protein